MHQFMNTWYASRLVLTQYFSYISTASDKIIDQVRRVLGRSFKPKIKSQDSRKESLEKKEKAEQMRRGHREQEQLGSKWKPGSKDVTPDARPVKAKLLKGRRMMKMKTAEKSKSKEEKSQSQEERSQSQEERSQSQEEKSQSQEEKSQSQGGKYQSQEEPKKNEDEHSTIKTENQEDQQEEMVSFETNEQDWSQPTFPDFPDLTFSSNDHLQPPYHQHLEAKIGAERDLPELTKEDVPNLTDSSDLEDSDPVEDGCITQLLVQPLPPCMVFFQVHQDHLCSPVAHLGSWPAPPPNSIFVPPDFPAVSVPDLLKRTWYLPNSSDMEDDDQHVPSLTDSSDVEDFYMEGDPDNQPTFPDISFLTFSSTDHLQPPYHNHLKAKISAKKVRNDLRGPELTDDSEDEENQEGTTKRSSRSTASSDLRGGSSLYFEEVYTMLELLKLAIDRTELPLRLDSGTPGDGNCFSHAVIQQCQRAPVRAYLERQGKTVTTFMQLKEDVRQFVLREKDLPSVRGLKDSFEQKQGVLAHQGKSTRGWSIYWDHIVKNGIWADDIFVQATALHLNLPIFLVIADSASYDQPIAPIEPEADGPPLLIGYISDKHYQSLLPKQEDEPSTTNCITLQALRTALDSLQLDHPEKRSEVGSKNYPLLPKFIQIFALPVDRKYAPLFQCLDFSSVVSSNFPSP